MSDPETVQWYQSSQIRTAVGLFVPGMISLLHITKFDKKLGINLDDFSIDSVTGMVTAIAYVGTLVAYPVFSAILWISKRVKAGLDPKSPAPEIQMPPIASAVIRLSKTVNISR